MITKRKALNLLHQHTFHLPYYLWLRHHSLGVADIAFEIAKKIKRNHPHMDIHPHKLKIAGILHDIWKARDGHHELNSAKILREHWLHEIADIIIHSFVYELFLLEWEEKKEYLPHTIENKILVYADYLFHHTKVGMQERIADILERKQWQTNRIKALKLAKNRLEAIEKEIQHLIHW
jgi:putative nucleotidyltransferase with HDIG domain